MLIHAVYLHHGWRKKRKKKGSFPRHTFLFTYKREQKGPSGGRRSVTQASSPKEKGNNREILEQMVGQLQEQKEQVVGLQGQIQEMQQQLVKNQTAVSTSDTILLV